MEKLRPVLKQIGRTLYLASIIVIFVTAPGIAYGLIVHKYFTMIYAFRAGIAVSAVLIAGGLLFPLIPNRIADKFRSRQFFEYKMHMEYMQDRAKKQEEGFQVLWIGIAAGSITGLIEIFVWLF